MLLPAVCVVAVAPAVWAAVRTQLAPAAALPVCLAVMAMISLLVFTLGERVVNAVVGRRPRQPDGDDELTGLLGRRAFLDEAGKVVTTVASGPGSGGAHAAAFLLIDLDRFRDVNDTLGHDEGDRLLRRVGQRLRRALQSEDLLGHLGGDDFAVVIAHADAERAQRAAQRLRAALREPLRLGDMSVPATASVGIALAPVHGRTVKDLLGRAEAAMYEAKRECSGQRVFDSGCRQSSRDRLRLRAEISSVFDDGQLELRYQPKADLRTGRVTSVEALVRWRHPVDGLRPPDVFLPEMERAGLMRSLTERVIDLALGDHMRWRAAGEVLPVSVNVPASVIVEEAFIDVVRDALARHGLPPASLIVEVTEDGLITAREQARRVLAGIRSAGVRVSLDDYGTGFCSLAYLRELPADELKLDRSFLGDIEHSASAAEIVRSTVDLAHALDLTIVAEGVESAASWAALAGWGCDEAQGYFVSPPIEGDRVLKWLYEWWQRVQRMQASQGLPDVPHDPAGYAADAALAAFTPTGTHHAHHAHQSMWLVGFRASSQRGDAGSCRSVGARGRPGRQLSSP